MSQLHSSLDQAFLLWLFRRLADFLHVSYIVSFCSTSELDKGWKIEVVREAKKIGRTGSHKLLFFLNAATILTEDYEPEKSFYNSFCPIWELLCFLGTEEIC